MLLVLAYTLGLLVVGSPVNICTTSRFYYIFRCTRHTQTFSRVHYFCSQISVSDLHTIQQYISSLLFSKYTWLLPSLVNVPPSFFLAFDVHLSMCHQLPLVLALVTLYFFSDITFIASWKGLTIYIELSKTDSFCTECLFLLATFHAHSWLLIYREFWTLAKTLTLFVWGGCINYGFCRYTNFYYHDHGQVVQQCLSTLFKTSRNSRHQNYFSDGTN